MCGAGCVAIAVVLDVWCRMCDAGGGVLEVLCWVCSPLCIVLDFWSAGGVILSVWFWMCGPGCEVLEV